VKSIIYYSIFVILFSFTVIFPVYCEDTEEIRIQEETAALITEKAGYLYNFSVSPFFGFVHGQAVELVYPTITISEYLSELLWNMKPVYYIGGKLDFFLTDKMSRPGFFSSISIRAGVPGFSGKHENRDWNSKISTDLTHYSVHDNKTIEFFWMDFEIGATIPVVFFYIKPFLTGSWMRFSFSGHYGDGIYARGKDKNIYFPISDNPNLYPFSGRVITYRQNWFLAAAGLSIGTDLLSPFYIDMSFSISPLTYCAAVDQHLTQNRIFYDYSGFGLFMEPKAGISYKFQNLVFSVEGAYRHIGRTRGVAYERKNNSEYVTPVTNESGAGLSLFSTKIMMRILL